MTDEQRQRLSALLDGEGSDLDQQRAISDALDHPELRAQWERYATIGRLIRGEPVLLAVRGVAPRVAAVIADEPQAPAPTVGAEAVDLIQRTAAPALRRTVWPAPARRGRPSGVAHRPLVGLALAAGVALLAVVVGPRLLLQDAPGGPPLALVPSGAAPTVIEHWRVGDAAVAAVNAPRLNQLLVSHRERSASLTGMMPYVTVVGYGGAR